MIQASLEPLFLSQLLLNINTFKNPVFSFWDFMLILPFIETIDNFEEILEEWCYKNLIINVTGINYHGNILQLIWKSITVQG